MGVLLVVLAWAEAAVEGAENPGVERGSVAFGRWGSAGKRTEDVGDWVETGVVALSGSDSYSSSVSSNSTSAVSATKLLKRLKSDDAEGFSMVFVLGGFPGEAVILVANSVFEMVAKYSGGKTPSLDVS